MPDSNPGINKQALRCVNKSIISFAEASIAQDEPGQFRFLASRSRSRHVSCRRRCRSRHQTAHDVAGRSPSPTRRRRHYPLLFRSTISESGPSRHRTASDSCRSTSSAAVAALNVVDEGRLSAVRCRRFARRTLCWQTIAENYRCFLQ